MNTLQITRNQHFVPKFYLKRFAPPGKLLHVFDVKGNRMASPKPPSGLGCEHFFYAAHTGIPDSLSQDIEEWLEQYETIISKAIPRIIEIIRGGIKITDDQRYLLAALMCLFWLRSPNMRSSLTSSRTDLISHIKKLYPGKKNMTLPKEFEIDSSNIGHLKFMTESFGFGTSGFTNLFYAQNWNIYIAQGSRRFITTDSPVVEWWPPPTSFYDGAFMERNKYFPLTPEILIELTPTLEVHQKYERIVFSKKDDDQVHLFNILLAAHAHAYAFSSNREELVDILLGRIMQTKIAIQYYEKYKKPWDIYHQKQHDR